MPTTWTLCHLPLQVVTQKFHDTVLVHLPTGASQTKPNQTKPNFTTQCWFPSPQVLACPLATCDRWSRLLLGAGEREHAARLHLRSVVTLRENNRPCRCCCCCDHISRKHCPVARWRLSDRQRWWWERDWPGIPCKPILEPDLQIGAEAADHPNLWHASWTTVEKGNFVWTQFQIISILTSLPHFSVLKSLICLIPKSGNLPKSAEGHFKKKANFKWIY